jgi:hypothetical protein
MASYANFLGRKVTVSYRVSDILLPASGTLVGDSGRSIFLEQHLEQRGRVNYFRWEIPYQNIYRIAEAVDQQESTHRQETTSEPSPDSADPTSDESPARPTALAAGASAGASSATSSFLPHRPKTA